MATPNNKPAGSIGGIEYEEAAGSGEVTGGRAEITGTRIFHIDWKDSRNFFKALVGYTEVNNTAGGTTFYLYSAQRFPGWNGLRCSDVKIVGLGKPENTNGMIVFPYAKVTATYKFNKSDNDDSDTATDDSEVIVRQEMDFTMDFFEYDRFGLYWSGGIPIAEKIQEKKRMPIIIHTYTESKVPNLLNKKTFTAARMGRVNLTEYRKVNAGKLLYMGAKATREITTDGAQAWQVTHTFHEKPDAVWNKVFNPETNAYENVYNKDGEIYNIYDSIEFSGLISSDK
jgi:hypothetical protein